MRVRRPFRPALETMSSRITPSGLLPYNNPVLAPVMIKDVPPATVPPLAPVMIPATPCDEIYAGDGNPPPFGELPPPFYT